MIEQKNTFLWFKLNGLLRYMLTHTATRILPLFVVNEYPKSGGSWVSGMLSDALGVPFPRNRLPMLRSSILHGHMMQSWNMHNVLCVWRDGRDVLISQYFHWLFENDRGNTCLVSKCRADLGFSDYDDIASNIIPFMEYVYEQTHYPRFTWADFVDKWQGRDDICHVRYEDLREDTTGELQRIVYEISGKLISYEKAAEIGDAYSFIKMSGRKEGVERKNSFMRKGIVGDWKNHFTPEARRLFDYYAGEALIVLGYEKNHDWVEDG